jgi:hypothetical protein
VEDIIKAMFYIVAAIVVIRLVIYVAVFFITYIAIPAAILTAYGFICYRLGKTLFSRYRHTIKSGIILFLTALGSYVGSLFFLREYIPPILKTKGLIFLIVFLLAALIFLMVGSIISLIWAAVIRSRLTNKLATLQKRENRISSIIMDTNCKIDQRQRMLDSIKEGSPDIMAQVKKRESFVEDWEKKDAASRSLLVKTWRDGIEALDNGQLEKRLAEIKKNLEFESSAEPDEIKREQSSIKQTLIEIEQIKRTLSDDSRESDIMSELNKLEGEMEKLTDDLNCLISDKKNIKDKLDMIESSRPILN